MVEMWKQGFCLALIALAVTLSSARRDYKVVNSIRNDDVENLVTKLRNMDRNKAGSSQIKINWQGHTSSRDRKDNARSKLFSSVSSTLLNGPSYQKLLALYDNYNPRTGIRDMPTRSEQYEIKQFMDEMMKSNLMEEVRTTLSRNGYQPARSNAEFRRKLEELWFGIYSRARGQPDTCGFEHVFVGEWKNGVQGIHNWLRFYILEKEGKIDYKGFILKRNNLFGMIQYTWEDLWKPSGSFFIGTSPEFDFALYSFCFIARPGYQACKFHIDKQPFAITSFESVQNGKSHIGSLFPSPGSRSSG